MRLMTWRAISISPETKAALEYAAVAAWLGGAG